MVQLQTVDITKRNKIYNQLLVYLYNIISIRLFDKSKQTMDNFFAKKGIALSRQQPLSVHQNKQQVFKSSEEIHRQYMSQTPRPITKLNQGQWGTINPHTMHLPQQAQIPYFIENPIKLNQKFSMAPKNTFSSITERKEIRPQSMPKRNSYFLQQKVGTPHESFIEMQYQFHSISTDDQTSKSFLVKPLQFQEYEMNQVSNISLKNKVINPIQLSFESNSPRKLTVSLQEKNYLKLQLEQAQLKQKIMCQAMKSLQKQKQELSKKNRDGSPTKNYWIEEKIKLLKENDEKSNYIRELQIKLEQSKREGKVKISMLQYEIKKLKSINNRQQIQNENARKLLEVQRQKNDTAQNQMDKMMFFEDDLIHSKDYNKLKKELDGVLTQNSKMYQDHQKFILQVGETRRKINQQLANVEEQLSKLKGEAFQWRTKIQGFNLSSDDKRELIKLQHDINFLMKKVQQSREHLIQRQSHLEQAHHQIKQLTQKQNKRLESSQSMFNLQQFSETVILYESRIEDLNVQLLQFKNQIQKQKRTIESLVTELRMSRQDRHINSVRQKSNESCLKNGLMVLQQSYKSEQDLNRKKINTLQENIQRKTRQIREKDKFIRQFLINRAKRIEQSSMNQILESVRAYFTVEEPQMDIVQNSNVVEVDF